MKPLISSAAPLSHPMLHPACKVHSFGRLIQRAAVLQDSGQTVAARELLAALERALGGKIVLQITDPASP